MHLFRKELAATYSRGSYTTTTIGHAVFDGRVRNGNESDHCGITTKKLFFENYIQIFCKLKNFLQKKQSSLTTN